MKPILSRFLLLVCLFFAAPRVKAQIPAPGALETQKLEWFDARRARKVPVKLHFPRENGGALPLIILSHGLGGTRDGLDFLGTFWASHGYVCAQLQHPGSDESVWRGVARPMEAMRAATKNPQAINDRPFDMKFAIDELLQLNSDAKSTLFGRIDKIKIGAAGHSFGAFTAQAVAGRGAAQTGWRDPRVIASVALSAPARPSDKLGGQYGAFKTPFYLLTGTLDDAPIGEGKATDRRVPFDAIQGVEGYLLILKDATHGTLGGGGRGGATAADAVNIPLIQSSTLLFWDAYLKGSTGAKKQLRDGEFKRQLGKSGTFEVK